MATFSERPHRPTDPVVAAMRTIERADFLPEALRDQAHQDHPLPLADGSTNSQPSTVRRMLQALDVRPGHRVLDIGSGSGWTSALLGQLTGPEGEVLGLDLTDFLVDFARTALSRYDLAWVRIDLATPDVLGTPGRTWDRILVSADGGRIPSELVHQLDDGGRMVIPAAGRMAVVTRAGQEVHTEYLPGQWAFVRLR
ncbi:protein-L-isoaspartate O-methyltransferase family protein [Pseudactinotalea sp. Z1748]|uniref:protein-L-isoaspartate O-methyltransferase family protein n=1 Tax=Pseudactinotalea sp. Z1748 TaxID=3413027 RepID=UPI003C7EA32A